MPVVIPYVVQTWTDGSSQATAARMGVMEQGITDAHNMPCARVYHNANQSITSAVLTTLAFNSELFDTDTIHDTAVSNSRLTCKHAGVYQITLAIVWGNSAVGDRYCNLRHQGTTDIASLRYPAAASGSCEMMLTTLYKLAVNEYVEAQVYQNSGGPINVTSVAHNSPEFMMVRVGTG